MIRKYKFVDFASSHQQGFRNHVIPIYEVPHWIKQYEAFECFTTYFFYTDEILAYMMAHSEQGHPSISGYHGKVWATFLPMDIDAKDPAKALDTVRLMARTLVEKWKIPEKGVHFYFSGAKGFHVLLDVRLFGQTAPSHHLHQIFATLREDLMFAFPPFDHTQMDLTIKDPVRLLRLPNTVNGKTGLYKIPLRYEEILSSSMEEIKNRAKSPQPLPYTDDTGLISNEEIESHPMFLKMFERVHRQVQRFTRKPFQYRFVPKHGEDPKDFLCPSLLAIWSRFVEPGYRNNCAIRLVSEFRLNGLKEDRSRELINQWNEKNQIGLKLYELEHILRSAYAHPFPYRYSCHDTILQKFCPCQDFRLCRDWAKRNFKKKSAV